MTTTTGTTTGTGTGSWTATAPAPATTPAPRAGGSRPAVHRLVDVAVLLTALAAAGLPLLPAYATGLAAPALAGGLVTGAAVAAVAAWRAWTALSTLAVLLVASVVAGGPLAAPTTTVAGVVPTGDTVRTVLAGAVTVWRDVLTLQAPLGAGGGTLVAPYVLGVVGAAAAVGLALRGRTPTRAATAALVPALVGVLALVLGTRQTVLPLVGGTVTAGVLLTWVSWRIGRLAARRVVALLLTAAVAATGGAVLGPALGELRPRHVVRDEIVPPFDPREQPSPLAGYRRFVKDWTDTPLVTVRGLPAGTPVRLATLDAYDGVVWSVSAPGAASGSGTFRRPAGTGPGTAPVAPDRAVTVGVEVRTLPGVWLPTVGDPTAIDFTGTGTGTGTGVGSGALADRLRVNEATDAAVLIGGVPDGARYALAATVPTVPDDAAIGAAAAADVDLPPVTGVPDVVGLVAQEMAGRATTPLEVARALEAGLAERGWFSHGIAEAGDHPSLSGHGADRITSLLSGELMVGDSEQYASAMALMARELGLPARVVLGLRPDPDDGGDVTLTGGDAEAWVEIAFAGHGWVPFDPTPDESRTPDDRTPQDQAEPEPQVVQPPPPAEEPVVPPEEETEQPRTEDPSPGDDVAPAWQRAATVLAVAGAPLVLVLAPALLLAALRARRRRRRRTADDPVDRVVGGWEEVLDAAADLALPVLSGGTRREAAQVLARGAGPAGAPLAGLAGRADAVVFAPGRPADAEVDGFWAGVDAAVAELRAAVPRSRRLRARWSTASLRRRPGRAGVGTTSARPVPPTRPEARTRHRATAARDRPASTGPRDHPRDHPRGVGRRGPHTTPGVPAGARADDSADLTVDHIDLTVHPTPRARRRTPRDGES
ncbi:transglutaminase-like domain-containing protein [uncultured Cellulomonas sp.]|uniref:transglutaminase-like domain-containing protein n=1 Tax=uncultured Cellulomonas sp. TaxID=189682 RepID=UPI0026302120|nr:transglutaminase-like domain-containing protein [uncultured Cellulomonas sp.]